MGVGRFFYTPLLPLMEREFGFGPPVAGLIASANFAGYLVGSMAASFVPAGRARLIAFRWGLVLSVATTLGMGFAGNLPLWLALRGLGGVASAVAMIFAAGITAEALGRIGEEARVGWLFGGVGFGIAASALLVRFCAEQLGEGGLWFAAGAISAALLPIILHEVTERDLPQRA